MSGRFDTVTIRKLVGDDNQAATGSFVDAAFTNFQLPANQPADPKASQIFWTGEGLQVFDGRAWRSVAS